MTKVALLGTGTMGAAMARRMRAHGLAVRAWNRSRTKAEPLAADGVQVVDAPRMAAEGADVLITMLTDGTAVEAAMLGPEGGLAGATPGCTWLQTSTVGVAACRRLAELATRSHLGFVDAPVSGSKEQAERGELMVLAAGAPELETRVKPVLEAIARRTVWLGEVGAGTRAKLAMNAWVTGLVAVLAETITLSDGLDLDPHLFLDLLKGGPSDSPYAQLKGKAMIEGQLAPSFSLRLAHKDLRLILEAGHDAGASLPVLTAIEQKFDRAERQGRGDEDLASVIAADRGRLISSSSGHPPASGS
jgi:3-hydroxyisobutyrate dehydrogenase